MQDKARAILGGRDESMSLPGGRPPAQSDRVLRVLGTMDEIIDTAQDEESLYHATCRVIVEVGGYVMAWVGLAIQDARCTVKPVAHAGFEAAYLTGLDAVWSDTERGRGPMGAAIRMGMPTVAACIATEPSFALWREDALLRGYNASIALPLMHGKTAFAALGVYAAEADAFDVREARLLLEIARSVSRAVAALRARAELQKLNAELERRVAHRTDELLDLYENAPCGYHSLGQGGVVLRMNDTELRWLGYERHEVVGRSYAEFIAPDFRSVFEDNFKRLTVRLAPSSHPDATPQAPIEVEYDVVCKDGSRRTFLAHISILRMPDGQFVRNRSAVLDLSERKRAERALAERTMQVRDLLEDTSEIILTADAKGRVDYANHACCEALGYSMDELKGRLIFELVHPDERAASRATFASLMAGEAPRRRQVERMYLTKLGEMIHAEGVVSARVENDGVVGTRVFMRDVTRERLAEDAIRSSRDELSAANAALERAGRAKDEFLASMSHELRTPLNAVLGLSEALREGVYGPISDKGQRALVRIDESGRHLLSLINDILDLSKLEAGQSQLELRSIRVEDVCRASIQMIQEAADKKAQAVSVDLPSACGTVLADERRLVQILVNLLSNAVKFTPHGGALGLTVLTEEGRGTRFTVWDNGIGIAESDLPKLFQPFVQVDASLSRRHAGTGLGLALVRKLVALHSGGVEVTSELGEGSRFSVILPAEATDAPRVEPPSPKRRYSPAFGLHAVRDPRRGLGRVLLAEDDEVNVATVGDYLRSKGYEVLVARNGHEAVAMARSEAPDVILMDIQMPDLDGIEAMREIRADASLLVRDVPIVALTALVMPGDRERCIEAGADDYLTKPVRLARVLEVVEARRGLGERS